MRFNQKFTAAVLWEVDEICAQHGMTSLEMLISDCLDSYDDSSAKTWGTKFGSIAVKILTDVSWRCFFGECAGDFMNMHTIYLSICLIYFFSCNCNVLCVYSRMYTVLVLMLL